MDVSKITLNFFQSARDSTHEYTRTKVFGMFVHMLCSGYFLLELPMRQYNLNQVTERMPNTISIFELLTFQKRENYSTAEKTSTSTKTKNDT